MAKVIEINDSGFVWHVPLLAVAENRADHYADDPDTTREEEIALVMDDGFEGIDWFANNMNFSDIADRAKLVRRPKDKAAPDPNSEMRIIDDDSYGRTG